MISLPKAPPADTARPGTEPFGVVTVIFPVHIIARVFPVYRMAKASMNAAIGTPTALAQIVLFLSSAISLSTLPPFARMKDTNSWRWVCTRLTPSTIMSMMR